MILLNEKSHKPHILILDEACGIFLFLGIVTPVYKFLWHENCIENKF